MYDVSMSAGGARGERSKLLLAIVAVASVLSFFLTGGPVQRPAREAAPELASLSVAETEDRRVRPPKRDAYGLYRPTTATVRLPDSARQVIEYFGAMNYHLSRVREGGRTVPRVYVAALPAGMPDVEPVARRKALFIRSLLPLALKANERIRATRSRVRALRDMLSLQGKLPPADREWLIETARRYRLPVQSVDGIGFEALLKRVDVVPPSLALAQSILESGWGTSRFARRGNALFGQRTWDDAAPGLKPKEADGFRVRAFASLAGSVRAYMLNLNTAAAYAGLREKRAEIRAGNGRIDGYVLAAALRRYSEEGDAYVEKLRNLMAHNGLRAFDGARLRSSFIAQRVVPDGDVRSMQVALRPRP